MEWGRSQGDMIGRGSSSFREPMPEERGGSGSLPAVPEGWGEIRQEGSPAEDLRQVQGNTLPTGQQGVPKKGVFRAHHREPWGRGCWGGKLRHWFSAETEKTKGSTCNPGHL